MEKRDQFKEYLKNSECEITIIKMGATWCRPCVAIAPYIKKVNDEYSKKYKYNYVELDIDQCTDTYAFLKQKKMVRGVPVLLCYNKCNFSENLFYIPTDSITGPSPQDIVAFYKRNVS